jgi:hypothetical protein
LEQRLKLAEKTVAVAPSKLPLVADADNRPVVDVAKPHRPVLAESKQQFNT